MKKILKGSGIKAVDELSWNEMENALVRVCKRRKSPGSDKVIIVETIGVQGLWECSD